MRVSTAFNRILQVPGANVTDVTIGDRDIEVTVRLKARSLRCPCGKRIRAGYVNRPEFDAHRFIGAQPLIGLCS